MPRPPTALARPARSLPLLGAVLVPVLVAATPGAATPAAAGGSVPTRTATSTATSTVTGTAVVRPRPVTTLLVPAGTGTRRPEGGDYGAAISQDGRWVAFWSEDALLASDTNHRADLYLRDLTTGALTRVPGLGDPYRIDSYPGWSPGGNPLLLSADGRWVVYRTDEQQLPGQAVPGRTYRYDRVLDRLEVLLPQLAGLGVHRLSADGRFLLISAAAPDLAPGPPSTVASAGQAYVADLVLGGFRRVVPRAPGPLLASTQVDMSADGKRFLVTAPRPLDGGKGGGMFVRARSSTLWRRVPGGIPRYPGSLNADGRYVVFGSERRLVRSDTNDVSDVYRWDSRTGALARVSITTGGRQCTRPAAGSSIPGAILPRQSADGTAVLFESSCEAFSGIRDVTSGTFRHLFLRDLPRKTLQPVDVTPAGRLAYSWAVSDDDGFAYGWDVSGNGSRVVFTGNKPFAPGVSGRLHVFLRRPLR